MSEELRAEVGSPAPIAVQAGAPVNMPGPAANKPIPKNLTAMKLLNETKAFVIVRALVCAAITGIMFGISLLCFGLCLGILYATAKSQSPVPTIIVLIIVLATLGGLHRFLRVAKSVVLYAIKAAHIAAITEYLRTGATPVTEKGYKGMLAFGKEKVQKNLGATAAAFVIDKLVARATRQIMRWVNKAQNLLSFIPGSDQIFKFVNFILSTALNFVDEAILSYIFYHVEEKNPYKKACDGLVYYAQAWKGMIMGATKVAVFVWVLRAICFVIFYAMIVGMVMLIPGGVVGAAAFIIGIIFAAVLTYGIQTALIEPYATCMMIKDYHIAIAGQPLKVDLYAQVEKVSSSFKELFTKSKDKSAAIPEGEGVAATATVAAEAPVA